MLGTGEVAYEGSGIAFILISAAGPDRSPGPRTDPRGPGPIPMVTP